MDGTLTLGTAHWTLSNARLGVSAWRHAADACLECDLDGAGARLVLPGPIGASIRTAADLHGTSLELSPEDTADIVPLTLDGVAGGLAGWPGALVAIVAVEGDRATLAYDGPFAWIAGDEAEEPREGSLRVVARIDIAIRDR